MFYPVQVVGVKPGYKQTPEHREKRIAALRGRVLKIEVQYESAHHRAKKFFQDAPCAHCGADGKTDMALRHDAPPEGMRYGKDAGGWNRRWCISHPPDLGYIPLCPPCHVAYDTANGSWQHHPA